jgi:hypothetical protein
MKTARAPRASPTVMMTKNSIRVPPTHCANEEQGLSALLRFKPIDAHTLLQSRP